MNTVSTIDAIFGTLEEVKHMLEPISQSPGKTSRLYVWLGAWTQSSYNARVRAGRTEL